jgi:hypothetical protein
MMASSLEQDAKSFLAKHAKLAKGGSPFFARRKACRAARRAA